MKFLIFLLPMLLAARLGLGQTPDGRLFVLNEGADKGTVGYIDYACGNYQTIDSVASFGNQIALYRGRVYAVDGDGDVHFYDQHSLQKLGVLSGIKARQVGFWNNQLLVTTNSQPYFRVYDINDNYAALYSLDTTKIRDIAEDVLVIGHRALVAVNGFGVDSLVAVVDLPTRSLLKTIVTPPNPNQMLWVADTVYVQCLNYQLSGGNGLSIAKIDVANLNFQGTVVTGDESFGGFTTDGQKIYYSAIDTATFVARFSSYSLASHQVSVELNADFYGLEYNAALNGFFVSQTDFFSTGSVSFLPNGGALQQTYVTDVSPRSFAYAPVSLGPDVTSCDIKEWPLTLPCGFTNILWSNGADTPTILAEESGVYSVTATSANGTVFQDTVSLSLGVKAVIVPDSTYWSQAVQFYFQLTSKYEADSYLWRFNGNGLFDFVDQDSTSRTVKIYQSIVFKNNEWIENLHFQLFVTKNGCTAMDTVTVAAEISVGIEDENQTTFTLYPNPVADGKISLNWVNEAPERFRLFSPDGRELAAPLWTERSAQNGQLSLPALPSGLYFLQAETKDGKKAVRKLWVR